MTALSPGPHAPTECDRSDERAPLSSEGVSADRRHSPRPERRVARPLPVSQMFSRIPTGGRPLPDASEPHETKANGVLRPLVFGGNDGLVSNLALVMGVAGAGPAPEVIVLAGVAGLIAGAFSMGVGEYISVQSQRELLDYQVAFQHKQLREAPEQERQILTDIYRGRGLDDDEAARFVDAVFGDPETAARLLLFEEVGLDERSIGSPLVAGVSSFLAFSLGAFIPLLPYLLAAGTPAFVTSLALSLISLALLGIGIAWLTRRSFVYSAARQVLLGGIAAAVTFAVGSLIGVNIG